MRIFHSPFSIFNLDVYRRINPDDWDDDGDPNEDDINPLVCDGSHFGPHQVLSEGANSNAYCWVDLVVRQANARMVFSGDGASDLPDPCFVAKAGETNRVIILIGKTYVVACDMPFEIVGKSDGEIGEWWEEDRKLWLNWPVEIWSQSDDEEMPLLLMGALGTGTHGPKGFTMFVSPSNLGGGFTWTNYCCSLSGNGYMFSYGCNGSCSCGGCSAQGYYQYEGYRLGASGGSCGCTGQPEDNPNPDTPEPYESVLGFVSVDFSKSVIFFEDAYTNAPLETVPWRSTESALRCSTSGGQYGGHVKIEIAGADNLVQYGGCPLPFESDLDPYEEIVFTNTYRAVAASASAEAIVVRGSFVSADATSDWRMDSMDKATAVKVEIEPQVHRNGAEYRHLLGVREFVLINMSPYLDKSIEMDEGWEQRDADTYQCPLGASNNGLTITINGCSYTPQLSVVEPTGVMCLRGWNYPLGVHPGQAGWVGMQLELKIVPEAVSFRGLAFVEEPSDQGLATGYFESHVAEDARSHDEGHGAGVWHDIGDDNFFFYDCPRIAESCPAPWSQGTLLWSIPIAWGERGASRAVDKIGNITGPYSQVFSIDATGGVRIDKFCQWIRRMPNGWREHSGGIVDVQ